MSYSDDVSSDDEIVWNVAEVDLSLSTNSSISPTSDDDFVVLSRPRSHRSSTGLSTPDTVNQSTYYAEEVLVSGLSRLALNEFPTNRGPRGPRGPSRTPAKNLSVGRLEGQRKFPSQIPMNNASGFPKKKKLGPTFVHPSASKSYPSPAASPNSDRYDRPSSTARPPPYVSKCKSNKAKKTFPTRYRAAASGTGLGSRPIVDDISERASDHGEAIGTTTIHEEAVKYITSFLTNPEAKETVCHLTLLQSLIIELGLTSYTPIIPSSLTAAKALLKSRAFLNIHEYLAVRDQGQAALQRVMHPSRTALIKDIRTKGNPASLKWVKQNGLQVFLVTCFH